MPVTFDTIFEVVRKSRCRTNIRYPNGEKWYAEVRRVALTLARRHITQHQQTRSLQACSDGATADVGERPWLSITKEANKCRIEQLADFVEKNMNVPTTRAATKTPLGSWATVVCVISSGKLLLDLAENPAMT